MLRRSKHLSRRSHCVVHVVPIDCNFYEYVVNRASESSQFVIGIPGTNLTKKETLQYSFKIAKIANQFPRPLFVFHSVNNGLIFLARSLTFYSLQYVLFYWGFDFYRDVISERKVLDHCAKKVSKSCSIKQAFQSSSGQSLFCSKIQHDANNFIDLPANQESTIFRTSGSATFFDLLVASMAKTNIESSAFISIGTKQFRILKLFYYFRFHEKLPTKLKLLEQYDTARIQEVIRKSAFESRSISKKPLEKFPKSRPIKFLICHSAVRSVNHFVSVNLVIEYCAKWNADAIVGGYLGYSGGSIEQRICLKEQLEQAVLASGLESSFCLEFLNYQELAVDLSSYDVAIFSSFRDEGVTTLRLFAALGGILSFNPYSFNYDFFKNVSPYRAGLTTHDALLNLPPDEIIAFREKEKFLDLSAMVSYEEILDHSCDK